MRRQATCRRQDRQWFLLLVCIVASQSRIPFGVAAVPSPFRKGLGLFSRSQPGEDDPSKATWSEFLTVDPSKILAIMIQKGGLIIPKSVEKELQTLVNVLNVDEAKLSLVNRELVLRNFTVSIPGGRDSLRVGRVHVRWDSYIRPCVDIEVDDVDFLLEFTNLVLTRNNWNELEAAGFPPHMLLSDTKAPPLSSSPASNTFVRIGSIDLSGNLTTMIRSRPLNQLLALVDWDMDTLDELNDQIRNVSDTNLIQGGRRGCTTEELYTILAAYFDGKVRSFLANTAFDMATEPRKDDSSDTVVKQLIAGASDIFKGYSSDVRKKTEDDIQDTLADKLEKMGLKSARKKLDNIRQSSKAALHSTKAKDVLEMHLNRVQNAFQSISGDTTPVGAGSAKDDE